MAPGKCRHTDEIWLREGVDAPAGVDHARREHRPAPIVAELEKRRHAQAHQIFQMVESLCRGPSIGRDDPDAMPRHRAAVFTRRHRRIDPCRDGRVVFARRDSHADAMRNSQAVGEVRRDPAEEVIPLRHRDGHAVGERKFIGPRLQREIADPRLMDGLKLAVELIWTFHRRGTDGCGDAHCRQGRISPVHVIHVFAGSPLDINIMPNHPAARNLYERTGQDLRIAERGSSHSIQEVVYKQRPWLTCKRYAVGRIRESCNNHETLRKTVGRARRKATPVACQRQGIRRSQSP